MEQKKNLVAIFAHPDDETFGPGGTLALMSQTYNVYLICVTRGEAGQNNGSCTDKLIADIRENELCEAAHLLGIKDVIFLDFIDGILCNNIYHQLANKIQQELEKLKPEVIMTFEPRGVSGHIDHIAVSMITTYVFEKCSFIQKLMYYCIDDTFRTHISDYFIYFPPGYKKSEIDETIDVSSVWDKKVTALNKHESQKADIDTILPILQKLPKEEYFLVKKRNKNIK